MSTLNALSRTADAISKSGGQLSLSSPMFREPTRLPTWADQVLGAYGG